MGRCLSIEVSFWRNLAELLDFDFNIDVQTSIPPLFHSTPKTRATPFTTYNHYCVRSNYQDECACNQAAIAEDLREIEDKACEQGA